MEHDFYCKKETAASKQKSEITKIIAIGGSAGSIGVIKRVIDAVPADFLSAIIIIVHHLESGDELLRQGFQNLSSLPVVIVLDKMKIEPGTIYFSPGNYHLMLELDMSFSLNCDEKTHFCRPSIDVTFSSLAEIDAVERLAILLSGANSDGARGLLDVKKHGGTTVIQSPESSEVDIMPGAAIEINAGCVTLSPEALVDYVINFNKRGNLT